METTYALINVIVMPFWLLMILAPRWGLTRRAMEALWPIAIVPSFYAGLLVVNLSGVQAAEGLDFSLPGIAALLGTPEGALVAWAHFLAFDLFVGRWVYLDGQARGLSHWLLAPALFFCLMAGPLGLLIYLGARKFSGGRSS